MGLKLVNSTSENTLADEDREEIVTEMILEEFKSLQDIAGWTLDATVEEQVLRGMGEYHEIFYDVCRRCGEDTRARAIKAYVDEENFSGLNDVTADTVVDIMTRDECGDEVEPDEQIVARLITSSDSRMLHDLAFVEFLIRRGAATA